MAAGAARGHGRRAGLIPPCLDRNLPTGGRRPPFVTLANGDRVYLMTRGLPKGRRVRVDRRKGWGMTGTDGEVQPLGPRSGTGWLVITVGLLALAGWVWALWLAFIPMHHGGSGGTESQALSCRPPVLFRESSFAHSIGDTWNEGIAHDLAVECADKNDANLRRALGVTVLATPLSLLWLWGAMVLRTRANAAGGAAVTSSGTNPSHGNAHS